MYLDYIYNIIFFKSSSVFLNRLTKYQQAIRYLFIFRRFDQTNSINGLLEGFIVG